MPTNRAEHRAQRRRMSVEERREQIVNAAATLFDKHGYAAVSVDDIAEVIGIAKPTLYYYFSSKTDILDAIHAAVSDFVHARFHDPARQSMSTPRQLFEAMADTLEMNVALPGYQRVYVEHSRELADATREIRRERRDLYRSLVAGLLHRGIEEGIFQVADVRLTTHQILGMVSYSYQWYSADAFPPPREIAVVFWQNMMSGIATPAYLAENPTMALPA